MRLRILSILSVMALVLGVASIAAAHHQDGHDQNYHGFCTAYFSGSENGQEKKRENGEAHQDFYETATSEGDRDGDGDVDTWDVADFCIDNTGGYGNPGQGNEAFFPEGDDEGEDCGNEETHCHEGGGGSGDGNNGNQNPPGQS